MNPLRRNASTKIALAIAVFAAALLPGAVLAEVATVPLFVSQKADPLVMLVLSNDHQLYIKAYSDYDDVNGDGTLDTTYDDNIDYYGYFDSNKCYAYDNGSDRFEPAGSVQGSDNHACGGGGEWSGNFLNWASMTRMDVLRKVLFGGKRSTDTTSETVLERVFLPRDIHAFAKVFAPPGGSADVARFTPYASYDSITLCNVSNHTSGDSQYSGARPQIRVARGSWPVWAATEQVQCQWDRTGAPDEYDDELATLTARVQVCVDGVEEENCKAYPGGTRKPTGLLQTYGEAEDDEAVLRLGLISGSYRKNRSGGVLRKNVVRISGNGNGNDEIDRDTGIFINQGDTDDGIINTISRFRISEWNGSAYEDCNTHSISVDELNENSDTRRCGNWGNPVGEMYLEALRYLVGETAPTPAFNASDAAYIPELPQVDWDDPYEDANWCAKPNVIVMSTGLNSFDIDQYSTVSAIPDDAGGSLDTAGLDTLVDEIGDQENITGNTYFIGDNGSNSNELCDAKTISALSDAKGICPETPNQQGGYDVAGLAWHAHTNDLRPALARGAGNGQNRPPSHEVNADTYALALAQGLPRITVNGMTFLPACQSNTDGGADNDDGGWLNCSLADLRIVDLDYDASGNLVAGNLLYQWEDSSWGNDYDLDGMERIEFCAGSACSPAVNADQVKLTVSSPYAFAGNALRFGYVVTGSTTDGIRFNVVRDGNRNFSCLNSDLTTSGSCSPVDSDDYYGQSNRFPQNSVTLTAGSSSGDVLEPPLWYAAKYGVFEEEPENADGIPNNTAEWDADGDGTPDGYFQVTDPGELIAKLGSVFESIMKTSSSAASVATNSTRLDVDTVVYQARFNSEDWRGHLLAFDIESDGDIGDPTWDAADLIPAAGSRDIFTWNPDTNNDGNTADGAGRAFSWASLSTAQQAKLNTDPDNNVDGNGDERLAWLRGDASNEKRNGGAFRNRTVTVLGDIVNSDPFYVGTPDYRYHLLPNATEAAAYTAFRQDASYQSRTEMLYVGANDGMLHAFNANTGIEEFAYIPNLVYDHLSDLPDPDYTHRYFVDGSPRAGDAYINGEWKTVLLGTLGAGGAGVFALDVTNPGSFGASDVMWEFTDADLGDMSGQATIVRLNDGNWYALFGNGFESAAGKAVLYLVDLETAAATKFVAHDGPNNGLATPVPVDVDGDRVTDYVYAGDIHGNLWKFDFSGGSGQWGVAFKQGQNRYPLFTATDDAGNPQPITQRPAVGVHPDGGYMVYFGTGSFYAEGDNVIPASPDVQTFYGIRDAAARIDSGRSELQEQTIDAEISLTNADVRVVSNHNVDYASDHGWYIDLVSPAVGAEGERSVANPVLRGDRIIFTTLIPSSAACDFGGTGWLMELDAINGKRLPYTVLDVNDDGVFDEEDFASIDDTDYPVSGMRSSVGIIKSPGIISAGDKEYKYASGSTGEIAVISERSSLDTGRKSWREVR